MVWSWPIVAVVFFAIGFAAGFAAAETFKGAPKRRLKVNIALLITGVWALSIVAGIFVDGYTTSIALHAIMGAIAGWLFKDADESSSNPVTDALTGGSDDGGEE